MKRPLLVCLAFGAGMAGTAQARDFIVEDHLLAASDAPLPRLLGDRDAGHPYGNGSRSGAMLDGSSYRGEDSAAGATMPRGGGTAPTPTAPTPTAAPPLRDTARSDGTPSATPTSPRKPRNGEPSWQSLLPGSIQ